MTTILKHYFDECKEGKVGVMPYCEGESVITFVWNDRWMGRICKLSLTKHGKEYALKRYSELEKSDSK